MIAARIHSWGGEPVIEEVPDPVAAAGETLVAIAAGSVAHIDLTVAGGKFAFRPELPYVPGTEGSGLVVRSRAFPPRTPVRIRGGGVGLARDGTWAELAAVPDDALDPLPEDVDLVLAAVFFSPCVTAHLAIDEVGRVEPGERVAVRGAAGAVGSVALQLAVAARAAEVIGIVRTREKAAALPAGARALVGEAELSEVDLLVDIVGGQGLAELVTRAVTAGGRAVLVGYTAGTDVTFHLPSLLAADVRLLPVNLIRAERRMRGVARDLLARLHRGELELAVNTYPLERVAEAMENLRRGAAVGKVAVTPVPSPRAA